LKGSGILICLFRCKLIGLKMRSTPCQDYNQRQWIDGHGSNGVSMVKLFMIWKLKLFEFRRLRGWMQTLRRQHDLIQTPERIPVYALKRIYCPTTLVALFGGSSTLRFLVENPFAIARETA